MVDSLVTVTCSIISFALWTVVPSDTIHFDMFCQFMNHFESVNKITSACDSSWHDNNCFYIIYCISNSKFCTPIAFGFAFQSVHARQVSSQSGGSEHNTTLLGTTAGPSYGSTDCWIPHFFFLLYLPNPQWIAVLYLCVWLLQCQYGPHATHNTPHATSQCHTQGQCPTACDRGTLPDP